MSTNLHPKESIEGLSKLTEEHQLIVYQEALTQLRMHAPLIWTRNNFFLVVQTGTLCLCLENVAFDSIYVIGLCFIGWLTSIIWFVVIKEGRDIQRGWRRLVIEVESVVFKSENAGPLSIAKKSLGEGHKLSISITTQLLIFISVYIMVWSLLLGHLIWEFTRF